MGTYFLNFFHPHDKRHKFHSLSLQRLQEPPLFRRNIVWNEDNPEVFADRILSESNLFGYLTKFDVQLKSFNNPTLEIVGIAILDNKIVF